MDAYSQEIIAQYNELVKRIRAAKPEKGQSQQLPLDVRW
jgi:hypothetical protein